MNNTINSPLVTVTEYRLGTDEDHKAGRAVYVSYRGNNKYIVTDRTSVLNSDGEWEWEPSPSNRDDDFIARTRFNLSDALRLAEVTYRAIKK